LGPTCKQFLFKPEKPDKTLGAKLRDEYPAILRWMIDGCLDWQENGLISPNVVSGSSGSGAQA